MSAPTTRESDKFVLRLPDGMRDRIKAIAEVNNRSMNAEIVATLDEKYPPLRHKEGSIQSALLTLLSAVSENEPDILAKEIAALKVLFARMSFEKAEHEAGEMIRDLFNAEGMKKMLERGDAEEFYTAKISEILLTKDEYRMRSGEDLDGKDD